MPNTTTEEIPIPEPIHPATRLFNRLADIKHDLLDGIIGYRAGTALIEEGWEEHSDVLLDAVDILVAVDDLLRVLYQVEQESSDGTQEGLSPHNQEER